MFNERFPELFSKLSSEGGVPESVIGQVLFDNQSVDQALSSYTDELESLGMEEPEWLTELDEFDFDEPEMMLELVNTFRGVQPPNDPYGAGTGLPMEMVAAEAEANPNVEELARFLDDIEEQVGETELDDFEIYMEEITSKMNDLSDDDVDDIMREIDEQFTFDTDQLTASIDAETILDSVDADAEEEGAAAGGNGLDDEDDEDDEELPLDLYPFGDDGDDDEDTSVTVTGVNYTPGSMIVTEPGGLPQEIRSDGSRWTYDTGLNEWHQTSLAGAYDYNPYEGWDFDQTLDPGALGDLPFTEETSDETWDRNNASSLWTMFFDQAKDEYKIDVKEGFTTEDYEGWVVAELRDTRLGVPETIESGLDDRIDSSPMAASLFNWAWENAERGLLDEETYAIVQRTLTGVDKQGNKDEGAIDYRPYIVATGELNPDVFPPDNTGSFAYPTFDDAKRGWVSTSVIGEGKEGKYYRELTGIGVKDRARFKQAWLDANPSRFLDKYNETQIEALYQDANMASIIGEVGEWREGQAKSRGFFDRDQEEYVGYSSKDEKKRFLPRPFKPTNEWYADFIKNASAHRTALYRNAVEIAEFLDSNAWVALGEDFERMKSRGDRLEDIANRAGIKDIDTDDDALRRFQQWSLFNPLLHKGGSNDYTGAEDRIKQLAVSALVPVNANNRVRLDWKKRIEKDYDAWVGGGNNPNSFLKHALAGGRVLSTTSMVGGGGIPVDPHSPSMRIGEMGAGGYMETIDTPSLDVWEGPAWTGQGIGRLGGWLSTEDEIGYGDEPEQRKRPKLGLPEAF